MMFELLLDGMDRFLNLRDTNAEGTIALLPSKVSELWKALQSSNRCPHLHESHRTLRDGSLGWRTSPRHFVPGYDRTLPPGHFATGSS